MKIIWLEDQPRYFQRISNSVEELGVEITFAVDQVQFATLLAQDEFNIALLDIRGGEFNGVDVYVENRDKLGSAVPIFLSSWLLDDDIKLSLSQLPQEVFVMEKFFPTAKLDDLNSSFITPLRLVEESARTNSSLPDQIGIVTNREYYNLIEHDQNITYNEYVNLTQTQRKAIKAKVIAGAMESINKEIAAGNSWFLISSRDSEILKAESIEPDGYDSNTLSNESSEHGYPCFVYETRVRLESINSRCVAKYKDYYTLDLSLRPDIEDNWKPPRSVHFDTGFNKSVFDAEHLKHNGISIGVDYDHTLTLWTIAGEAEVDCFKTNLKVRVHCQINPDSFLHTQLPAYGVDRWSSTALGGLSVDVDDLCGSCQSAGRCLVRVGLIGQSILGKPDPIKLVIDGDSGTTSPINN